MELTDYQIAASKTAIYPRENRNGINYCIHGLTNEAGEVSGKWKKHLRGDYDIGTARDNIKKELGDTLWYLSMVAMEFGLTLDEIAIANLAKLDKRAKDGTIKGNGDNR